MVDGILVARGVEKSFGTAKVLKGVDLDVQKGDRYALFGSNGSGKTTLVKTFASLLHADAGTIRVFGKDPVKQGKKARARIGFITHETFLYSELTAWENLDFFADLYSIPNKEKRIKTVLRDAGLYHRAYDKVAPFSRGMKQRLSLARATLHDPDLLFLDEPYTGLDMNAQEDLNSLVKKLSAQGKTFLFITHDVDRGFEVANRYGVLSNGRIAAEGEARDKDSFSSEYADILGREHK